ncbi:HEAT repeat domain-containing protein [Halobacterium hubeiense]|uniref:HEAT repeat domain-containing protein n=1 Tax=Halobacterium hubeiense TaxID=1407499 RepID=UPI003C72AC2A
MEKSPDPDLSPAASPGFGEDVDLEDVDVGRDVTLGEASHEEMTAADTSPVEDDDVATLVARLREGDVPARRRAALALAERADPGEDALDALAAAATGDDDDDVRQFAVEALGELGGERAREAALAAADDPDPWTRAEAYVALDHLDRAAYEDVLRSGLDDDHHAVRQTAAVSLFKHRGVDAADALLELADDPSSRVREWVAHMLGGVPGEHAADALATLAADDDDVVARTAERALDADTGAFRRQFRGAAAGGAPGDDPLNQPPDL